MYTLPLLSYEYDALQPAISADIMKLHHDKHHRTYVDKLNAAVQLCPELKSRDLVSLLSDLDSVPDSVRQAVRNHGGGHYNHSLFWQCMTPRGSALTDGPLRTALVEKWGSFDKFCTAFSQAATGLFGSGWVWLTQDLSIVTTANQDTPMALGHGEPLMGLDVWEHAYYLDYTNRRDEYIAQWWTVVDWQFIASRYDV